MIYKVEKYTKIEGNNEIRVQSIFKTEPENVTWLVNYRFGGIERFEYFNNEEEAKQTALWADDNYKLISVGPVEVL